MVVCRKDPCGLVCIFLTYCAVLYADYVVLQWILLPTMSESLWGALNAVIFNTLLFFLTMAHIRAVFSDPGVVPLPHNNLDFSDMHSGNDKLLMQKENGWTVCTRCETYRPPRAHHCRICQRCIRRMDHHCPWINNCVGEFNQKYFIQFLIYVGLASIYAIILVITSWINECTDCKVELQVKQSRVIHSILLLIECLLFGIFVVAIMCDQFTAILSDETGIEHIQKRGSFRPRKPKMTLLSEVCGRGPMLMWLLPCQNPPKNVEPGTDYDV
ncbi:hypothetical protein CHUAL_000469 [Chamberlinius hualienensis]